MNTHTDKELLELAAKAAGYTLKWKTVHCKGGAFSGAFISDKDDAWTPLTDDGDALRLAVECRIDVKHYEDYVVGWFHQYFGTGKIPYGDDPCASTRLAIVRAAAEIGKKL